MQRITRAFPVVLAFAFASVAAHAGDIKYHPIPGSDDLPFSDAVQVGNLLFLSGKIGNVPGTRDLPEGIQAQTRQTMDNIQATLERLGASMSDVVKCTVFLADMTEWGAMNEVYRTYFENPPARSALGANGLALGALVEIECIAAVGDHPNR